MDIDEAVVQEITACLEPKLEFMWSLRGGYTREDEWLEGVVQTIVADTLLLLDDDFRARWKSLVETEEVFLDGRPT